MAYTCSGFSTAFSSAHRKVVFPKTFVQCFLMHCLRQGADKGEVPVGAVLVHNGIVLAADHNRVEETSNPTAHAEMLCLQQAAANKENWRLLQSTLYVTLEPCPMCAGAMLLSRVGTLVYGTRSPLMGAF